MDSTLDSESTDFGSIPGRGEYFFVLYLSVSRPHKIVFVMLHVHAYISQMP